jgi:hypothetical protein
MTTPIRLRLSRAKGFDLQALSLATNGLPAVNVGRPSKWGNPFRVGDKGRLIFKEMTDDELLAFDFSPKPMKLPDGMTINVRPVPPNTFVHFAKPLTAEDAVRWFGQNIKDKGIDVSPLRGKNLACSCALDAPCHADVLLELANRPTCDEVTP